MTSEPHLELLSVERCFDGYQKKFSFFSEQLQSETSFSIFLPSCLHQPEDTDVLIWLSGLTCNEDNFFQKAGAQRLASELGMIIVAPDTSPRGDGVADSPNYDLGKGAGFYVDATEEPWHQHYKMFSFINTELYDVIKREFPSSDIMHISGHSMGGHGALISGIKHPEKYASISAFSPIVSPSTCAWGKKAFSNYLGTNEAQWQQYDACWLLENQPGTQLPPILIDQGLSDEYFCAQSLTTPFENVASRNKAGNIEIHYREGYTHSYYFIATFIESHLRFHKQHR